MAMTHEHLLNSISQLADVLKVASDQASGLKSFMEANTGFDLPDAILEHFDTTLLRVEALRQEMRNG